ncbi:hypothetical protein [Ruegeria arenilitoris]|uniref:hypothetical protein n=1 Tax=Ruegeria arenilitoris TaxID=1173585 RepID=UPI00147D7853|nr:hypothetical protein [Ruegeria arenilitoris]
MLLRSLLICFAAFSLTACSTEDGLTDKQFWEITESCNGQQLCTYANVFVLAFGTLVGEPDKDGFEVTEVTTDGKTVFIEASIPDAQFDEYNSLPSMSPDNIRLADHFDGCRDEAIREFLELGGVLKINVYNSSGDSVMEEASGPC